MALGVLPLNHFDGHRNLTQAQEAEGGPALAKMFRKFRTGQTTHGGAGAETLTFAEAFEDASYTVSAIADTAGADSIVTSKTAAGVEITVAAACTVDIVCIHD